MFDEHYNVERDPHSRSSRSLLPLRTLIQNLHLRYHVPLPDLFPLLSLLHLNSNRESKDGNDNPPPPTVNNFPGSLVDYTKGERLDDGVKR